jgi:Domain of unknown function (DUF4276)
MPVPSRVLEICGEGKTDVGRVAPTGSSRSEPQPPTEGVVPVLVHKLCGQPDTMRVVRRALPFLQGKKLWQKVKFVEQTALYNEAAGAVFVIDTEGNHRSRLAELVKGRDSAYPDFPMAVGVAHPCIEAWLLADPVAIAQAMGLSNDPREIDSPEDLPAPQRNRDHNPKTVLAECARGSPVSSRDATRIAAEIVDLAVLRRRCPLGFEPFAREVEKRIAPLFQTASR